MSERLLETIRMASTAILILDNEQKVEFINPSALSLMEAYKKHIRTVYPNLDLDAVVGTSLRSVTAIPDSFLAKLRDKSRKKFEKFVPVGEETFHITIHPILSEDGRDLGSSVEFWYATEYLRGQEHTKQMTEATELIEGLLFQLQILSINASIESTHSGESGNSFGVIAREMRNLSESCREAVKRLK